MLIKIKAIQFLLTMAKKNTIQINKLNIEAVVIFYITYSSFGNFYINNLGYFRIVYFQY